MTTEEIYRLEEAIKIRELPEWAGALVYTPHAPNLTYLNTTSWTVLQLSEGSTRHELVAAMTEVFDEELNQGKVEAVTAQALEALVRQRILRVE